MTNELTEYGPNRLAEHRTAVGSTQAEVADKVGVTESYISYLESGKRRLTKDLQEALAALYGVKPYELYVRAQDVRR